MSNVSVVNFKYIINYCVLTLEHLRLTISFSLGGYQGGIKQTNCALESLVLIRRSFSIFLPNWHLLELITKTATKCSLYEENYDRKKRHLKKISSCFIGRLSTTIKEINKKNYKKKFCIVRANQWNRFYMIGTSTMKELN